MEKIMAKTLGDELSEALTHISHLIVKSTSPAEQKALAKLNADIAAELNVFVDEQVARDLPEYVTATAAFKAANAQAQQALDQLDQVAASILKFSKAIELFAKLAALVI
jgi:hypothetical protein